ncbi:MAG: hypothetical protein ACRBN8_46570 [Nannocystales bacterium]
MRPPSAIEIPPEEKKLRVSIVEAIEAHFDTGADEYLIDTNVGVERLQDTRTPGSVRRGWVHVSENVLRAVEQEAREAGWMVEWSGANFRIRRP